MQWAHTVSERLSKKKRKRNKRKRCYFQEGIQTPMYLRTQASKTVFSWVSSPLDYLQMLDSAISPQHLNQFLKINLSLSFSQPLCPLLLPCIHPSIYLFLSVWLSLMLLWSELCPEIQMLRP